MNFSNLTEMFLYQVNENPKKRFISFENNHYTYAEASQIICRFSRLLQEKGVTKGSKVILLLNNSPEFIFSVFAILACGGIVIPINVFLKDKEVSYIVDNSESHFLITSSHFKDIITNVRKVSKSLKEVFSFDNIIPYTINLYENSQRLSCQPIDTNIDTNDIAMFIYTSGTTGHPKGAMLTHKNLLSNISALSPVVNITKKDKFLVLLPMFHTYTFTVCLLMPVYVGASIIILASATEMVKKSFKNLLLFQRPTFIAGVPQVFSTLAKIKFSNWFLKFAYPIKCHMSGGAPLPMETFDKFKEKFGKSVIEGYGLSEASPVVSFNSFDIQKPGTVGKPLPDVLVKIVDQDEMEVPHGKVGELIVKGSNVMKGYWGMPKATDDAIKNGWLFTGDMAVIDDDGYITIVDRKKDLIITKGINVYPREVEEIIYKFPNVEAVAVIGIPSYEHGEIVSAYIQPLKNTTIDEKKLKTYLKSELANFKQPRIIKIIDNIPLTATGKVLKRQLKEMVKNGQL